MTQLHSGAWGDIPYGATILSWYEGSKGRVSYYSTLISARRLTDDDYGVSLHVIAINGEEHWMIPGSGVAFNTKPSGDWLYHRVISKDGNPGIIQRRKDRHDHLARGGTRHHRIPPCP
jgi:hypothetical protein